MKKNTKQTETVENRLAKLEYFFKKQIDFNALLVDLIKAMLETLKVAGKKL